MSQKKTIDIPILARVEGEGALALTISKDQITTLALKIYEPPRMFEKFLEGRSYQEILDIVARICGICPVAYQMSAVNAIESAFQAQVTPWIAALRRLFYCGEWIESHSLHIHLLALPDFLGFQSAPAMAEKYPEVLKRGLRLQSFGNHLIRLLGGRSVHPIGACVGGFYKAPSEALVKETLIQAQNLLQDCEDLITWLSTLPILKTTQEYHQEFTSISLYHPHEYPMIAGDIVSNRGDRISVEEFTTYFKEFQVPYSTALHCLFNEKPYLVGPLARINHCFGHLPVEIHHLLQKSNLHFPTQNMFWSIIARAVEVYYALLEAIKILSQARLDEKTQILFHPRAGVGFGATEAPRGLLWHQYQFNDEGKVEFARIIPPTSQNQARIEEDLKYSLNQLGLSQPKDKIAALSEQVIRNYDPCISCATHFLKVELQHL